MNGNRRHPRHPPSTTHIVLSVQLSTKYKNKMSNLCAQHDTSADLKNCHVCVCVCVCVLCTLMR